MTSDAYATGQAMVMLHQIHYRENGRSIVDSRWLRGLEFLRTVQSDDGSWHVRTRAVPVQDYFDNGDPHGKDQFLSMMATGWAVTAIMVGRGPNRHPLTGNRLHEMGIGR